MASDKSLKGLIGRREKKPSADSSLDEKLSQLISLAEEIKGIKGMVGRDESTNSLSEATGMESSGEGKKALIVAMLKRKR